MSKTGKKYINQEEWIKRLEEELKTTKNEKRKEYLKIWINAIKCQPTVDINENIKKLINGIVERLEGCSKSHVRLSTRLKKDYPELSKIQLQHSGCYQKAIEIVKEEGCLNENT